MRHSVDEVGMMTAKRALTLDDLWSLKRASEEHWQRYRHHSPISYIDRICAPLLLIQAENDYRCPIDQGEQMLTALRVRRQTVKLIRMPGASHVIMATGAPHQRYFERRLTQDWFDTYVKNAGGTAAPAGETSV